MYSKMYVANKFQAYKANEIEVFIQRFNESALTWSDVLTLDYFYYHHTADYDGGLSFFDRLDKKLGRFHTNWDIKGFKKIVRNSDNPVGVYEDIVKYLLDNQNEINYYGT